MFIDVPIPLRYPDVQDARCLEILNSSIVHSEFWKEFREDIKKNGPGIMNKNNLSFAQDGLSMSVGEESDSNVGLSLFLNGCSTPDFVWVDEMISLGADTDIPSDTGENSLMIAIIMALRCRKRKELRGEIHPGYFRVIRRLLEIGVNHSVCLETGEYAGMTPLHLVCSAKNFELCELLLEFGADCEAKDNQSRRPVDCFPGTSARLLKKKFSKINKRQARPDSICWCLSSNKILKQCHGVSDTSLLPQVRDGAGCPCHSGKTYAKCCKKRGIVFKESRDQFSDSVTITSPGVVKVMEDVMRLRELELGRPVQPTDKFFGDNFNSEESRNSFFIPLLNSLVEQNQMDPAFAFAASQCDFLPRYWEGKIPKNEALKRQEEWNSAVDRYCEVKNDSRNVTEIERNAKISWHGSSFLRQCDSKQCNNFEETPEKRFKMCAGCRRTAYCSTQCQKDHWKNGHKLGCGTDEPKMLQSQYTLCTVFEEGSSVIDEVFSGMNTGSLC